MWHSKVIRQLHFHVVSFELFLPSGIGIRAAGALRQPATSNLEIGHIGK
jgi:hypothetical protein